MPATYNSVTDLAMALRRAADAHGHHEEEIGHADADWPDWYAQHMIDEQCVPTVESDHASPGAST